MTDETTVGKYVGSVLTCHAVVHPLLHNPNPDSDFNHTICPFELKKDKPPYGMFTSILVFVWLFITRDSRMHRAS